MSTAKEISNQKGFDSMTELEEKVFKDGNLLQFRNGEYGFVFGRHIRICDPRKYESPLDEYDKGFRNEWFRNEYEYNGWDISKAWSISTDGISEWVLVWERKHAFPQLEVGYRVTLRNNEKFIVCPDDVWLNHSDNDYCEAYNWDTSNGKHKVNDTWDVIMVEHFIPQHPYEWEIIWIE